MQSHRHCLRNFANRAVIHSGSDSLAGVACTADCPPYGFFAKKLGKARRREGGKCVPYLGFCRAGFPACDSAEHFSGWLVGFAVASVAAAFHCKTCLWSLRLLMSLRFVLARNLGSTG